MSAALLGAFLFSWLLFAQIIAHTTAMKIPTTNMLKPIPAIIIMYFLSSKMIRSSPVRSFPEPLRYNSLSPLPTEQAQIPCANNTYLLAMGPLLPLRTPCLSVEKSLRCQASTPDHLILDVYPCFFPRFSISHDTKKCVAPNRATHRKTHSSVCCHTNSFLSNRERKDKERVFTKSKNTSSTGQRLLSLCGKYSVPRL